MTTESDDQQFVITLVTVVNSSSIPFRERDRALQVMSDEKKRKQHRGGIIPKIAYHSAFYSSRLWQEAPRACRVLRFRPRRARRFHPHS